MEEIISKLIKRQFQALLLLVCVTTAGGLLVVDCIINAVIEMIDTIFSKNVRRINSNIILK